jgi:hypothetical protein
MLRKKITSSEFLKLVVDNTDNMVTNHITKSPKKLKLRLKNEKNSIKNILVAMTLSLSLTSRVTMIHISKLDLGKLTGDKDDDENKQAQFLKTFGDHCPKIVYLRLGKACINTENDSHVKYFCETIEHQLEFLKSLNLSGLDLNDDEACKIIMACEQRSENCQIKYINLSDNELACLDFVIPEYLPKLKMNLVVLNLSKNNLGFAGDPFAKESDALYDTIQTLNTIMLEFPMLSTLKMNNCNLSKYEGIAIAENLVNCTLTKLDLGNNNCLDDKLVDKSDDKTVKEKLLRAWKGPINGLIC